MWLETMLFQRSKTKQILVKDISMSKIKQSLLTSSKYFVAKLLVLIKKRDRTLGHVL